MFRLDNLIKHLYSLVYPILKALGMAPSVAAKYSKYVLRSERGALSAASICVFRDTLAGYYAEESRETARALRVSKIVLYKNMAAPHSPQYEYLVAWVEAEGCRPSLVKIERLRSQQKRPGKQPDEQNDKQDDKQPDEQDDKQPDEQNDKQDDKQPDEQDDKQPDKQPDEQPDKQPDEQPDKQPDEPTPKRSMFATDRSSASCSSDSISPEKYANDRITGLRHRPSRDVQVLTLEFGDNNAPLYYYQLVVLAQAVYEHNQYYRLFKQSFYWYAGVICGILRQQFPSVAVTESKGYDPHSCYGPLGVKMWHTAIDVGHINFWKEVEKFEEQEIGRINRQIQGFIKAKDEEIKAKDEEIRQKEKEIEELRKKFESLKPKNSKPSEAQNTSSDLSQNPADVPENHAGTSADAAKATATKSTAGGSHLHMKKTSMIKVQA